MMQHTSSSSSRSSTAPIAITHGGQRKDVSPGNFEIELRQWVEHRPSAPTQVSHKTDADFSRLVREMGGDTDHLFALLDSGLQPKEILTLVTEQREAEARSFSR